MIVTQREEEGRGREEEPTGERAGVGRRAEEEAGND